MTAATTPEPPLTTPEMREAAVLQWRPMARAEAARTARWSGLPWLLDEFESVALLELVRSARNWDPAKGAFSTIAVLNVRSRMRWAVRRALKRRCVSLDEPAPRQSASGRAALRRDLVPDHHEPPPAESAEQREEAERLRAAVEALPDRPRRAMRARLEGQTLRHLAEECGVSSTAVGHWAKRGERLLREAMIGVVNAEEQPC